MSAKVTHKARVFPTSLASAMHEKTGFPPPNASRTEQLCSDWPCGQRSNRLLRFRRMWKSLI